MLSKENQAVLAKVKRLLALGAGNANANEARAAMGLAQKLLEEHRLTMADVAATTTEMRVIYVGRTRVKWKHLLLGYVAEANGCVVLVDESSEIIEVNVAGQAFDIETVVTLYTWLTLEFERTADAEKFVGSARTQYLQGAALGVGVQLDEAIQKAREAENVSETAIVLVDDRVEKLKEELTKNLNAKRKIIRQSIHDEMAATRGYEDGLAMHLGKKLTTTTTGEEPASGEEPKGST